MPTTAAQLSSYEPADGPEFVARALDGDRAGRRRLAECLLDAVHAEVACCVHRRAIAAHRDPRQGVPDLVQEVMVALFDRDAQELRRWDPRRGRSLHSFVRLVARRRVARILGQHRGNPWAEEPVDPTQVPTSDGGAQQRRLEHRCDLDRLLEHMNAKMSVRDHELFDLLYVRELDPDDVARRMNMTRGAVNAWSYRLRKLARNVATTPTRIPATRTNPRAAAASRGHRNAAPSRETSSAAPWHPTPSEPAPARVAYDPLSVVRFLLMFGFGRAPPRTRAGPSARLVPATGR